MTQSVGAGQKPAVEPPVGIEPTTFSPRTGEKPPWAPRASTSLTCANAHRRSDEIPTTPPPSPLKSWSKAGPLPLPDPDTALALGPVARSTSTRPRIDRLRGARAFASSTRLGTALNLRRFTPTPTARRHSHPPPETRTTESASVNLGSACETVPGLRPKSPLPMPASRTIPLRISQSSAVFAASSAPFAATWLGASDVRSSSSHRACPPVVPVACATCRTRVRASWMSAVWGAGSPRAH